MITMKQKTLFIIFLLVWLLLGPAAVYSSGLTVAVLKSEGNFPVEDVLSGFKEGMQQHYSLELVSIEYSNDIRKISDEIARLKPDMLLCIGTKALENASFIDRIPKMYAMITNENAQMWSGRGDIFGVTLDIAPANQFRIMRQAFPTSKSIGVLYDPKHNRKTIEEAKKAAAATGFTLIATPVSNIREIPIALQDMESNIDVLWAIYDQTAYSPEIIRYILLQSLRKKIPMVGLSPHFAKAGALMAIYGDYSDMGYQIAVQAIAVSKGSERVPLISRPRKLKVAINEKVAKLLDINFPGPFMKTVNQIY